MDKKTGVYVCSGCGIGEALDADKLCELATKEYKVDRCQTHPSLCGEEGAQVIRKDIEDGVNSVVIAACSPRVKSDIFSYDTSTTVLERLNLREHVIWTHPANDEDTQMLAEDYLRMALAKIAKVSPPEPFQETIDKTILVVGGGISGMTSALEAAKVGYEVCLVEKAPSLGGWMAKLYKQFPKHSPYHELEDTGIEAKIKEVETNPQIKIFTGAEIEKIEGAPGMFDVSLRQNGDQSSFKAGSIIQATGFTPYDASKLDFLGFGRSPDVITTVQMEEIAQGGKIKRPSDGKEVESVAFILCAGSRDENHLPYCSSVCCLTALKQALYVREQNPDSKVYILYKDIRTPAQYEDFYSWVQENGSVVLARGEVLNVSGDGAGLVVEFNDVLLGGEIAVKADLVVLATGMVPNSMSGEKKLAEAEESGEEEEEAAKKAPDSGFYAAPALHLQYRQGPELPTLKYGFPDSHFICFPYETRRTGIYAAGCIRQPADSGVSIEDATGAALKAIQCVELTAGGHAVHPRTWDQTYPDLFMQRCTQCKRCTEECPFGMYNEDEKFNPLPNPTRCRRCAICMGSCPERIISFKDYSVDIIGSMVKAIEVPDEFEEKPRVVAFLCENDAYPALDIAGINRITYNPYVRVIPVRCLGSVNIVWIADALSKGIDGILMIGCKYGDDYQCHFIKGSELANYRMEKVQETLTRLVLEKDRIQVHQLSISEYEKLPQIFDDFLETMDKVGPNPYKGM